MAATLVDVGELAQTVLAAFVAGIGISVAFGIAVFAAARFSDATRSGRGAAATLFAALGILGLLVTAAGIAIGMIVMLGG